MSPIASIFVFATLAFLAASQVCGHARPEVYFSQPTPQEVVDNELWRKALVKLELRPDESVDHLLTTLNRAAHETSNPVDRDVYTMLGQLFTDIAVDPENLVRLSILIYNGMETRKLAKFKHYMKSIVGPVSAHYAALAEKDLTELLDKKPKEMRLFASFFRAALDVDKNASEKDFFQKLKQFDLTRSEYNVLKAYGVAKNVDDPADPTTKRGIFESFLDFQCATILKHPVKEYLNVINLAVGLESDYKMSSRVQLVNQYRRICLVWEQQGGWLDSVANFEEQMQKVGGLRRFFGALGGNGR